MTDFDIERAGRGYALNKMCYSLNEAANRAAFLADEDAYCARYGLSVEEREAIRSRDKGKITAAGGNMYFVAKFNRVLRGGDFAGWDEIVAGAGEARPRDTPSAEH